MPNDDVLKYIPQWVLQTLAYWVKIKKSGEVRIVFRDGGIRNIHRETEKEIVHPNG